MPPDAGTGAPAVRRALRTLADGGSLTADAVEGAFDAVVRGYATSAQIGALLMALRLDGERAETVAGVVRSLRRAMVAVPLDRPADLVDTCGTGGGSVTTFNVSTIAAFVAAGAGVRVAKHGNRSYTSRCGSADLLEALGVRIEVPVSAHAAILAHAGITFMFAPALHPAMRHVASVRAELGVTTIMNLVGPLANPAGAGRQVIGVADPERLVVVAGALAVLGTTHALVVYGEPGLDEVSPVGCTRVVEVRDGCQQHWTIDPERVGLPAAGATLGDLAGGDPTANAELATELLSGRGTAGARAAVLLNAAAAIYVAGRAPTIAAAVELARESLVQGRARAALDRLRVATARYVAE